MEEKELDGMIYGLLANFLTLSKEKGELDLYNFNKRDPRHLAAFHVASLLREMTGLPVRINTSLIDYLWIKWKFKTITNIKRTRKANIDVEKEIKHIEDANNLENGFFSVYKTYYEFSDRK